jgi:hypothetical protein
MSRMAARFVTQIQKNLDAWRSHEIDFVTFTESQRETWAAIRAAGEHLEADVLRALVGAAGVPAALSLADVHQRRLQIGSSCGEPSFSNRLYRGELSRSATGSPVLQVSPAHPRNWCVDHRQLAALVYDLAADFERRSQELEAHWAIVADAPNGQLVIELTGDHEAELADELITNLMAQHQLC